MNTETEKLAAVQNSEKKAAKKASTNEIPMIDLGIVLKFVEKIESGGLQTLTALEVAKKTGYTAPTSTPFYRRMAAAKMFGLLDTTQGVILTKLALDYFKPTDDESKAEALVTAIKNVEGYRSMLFRYSGRRLPQVEILSNLIEREFNLAADAAKICANVFVASVQQAGLVQADNMLITALTQQARPAQASDTVGTKVAPQQMPPPLSMAPSNDSESHYLTLDAKQGRRVVLQAPPVITTSELKRIQNWLAVQFDVVDSIEEGGPTAQPLPESSSTTP